MAKKKHVVRGRVIDCNIACKKSEAPSDIKNIKKRKLFVGGFGVNTKNGIFYKLFSFKKKYVFSKIKLIYKYFQLISRTILEISEQL